MDAPSPAPAADRRLWEVDALRGLMLALMTVTHVPTFLTDPLGQPFGFVSAAEGFVLLSGFMAGLVYAQRQRRAGDEAMAEAFLQRAWKIYLVQAALLLFVLTLIALIGVALRQNAITDLVSFFLEQPITALIAGLLLLYNPPLLDILPMYVVFMVVSPVLLVHAGERGWTAILAASVALWLGAQFGLSEWIYGSLNALLQLPVPLQQTGAFEWVAWQLLWVIGLWMGARQAARRPAQPSPFPHWFVALAVGIAVVHLVWRHAGGQAPFGGNVEWNLLYDKWRLGPLRLIDLFSLMVVVMHFGPRLAERMPRPALLELLGRQSLPVFSAHVVLAMLVLALVGPIDPERPGSLDLAVLTACFVVLYAVARVSERVDREAAKAKERLSARRRRATTSSAPRSPVATGHSPRG